MYCSVFQICFCHIIHIVSQLRIDKVMSNHCIKQFASYMNIIFFENNNIVFYILSYFQYLLIFKKRTEFIYQFLRFVKVGRNRNVISFPLFEGKGHPYQFAHYRVKTCSLGIETARFLIRKSTYQFQNLFLFLHKMIRVRYIFQLL